MRQGYEGGRGGQALLGEEETIAAALVLSIPSAGSGAGPHSTVDVKPPALQAVSLHGRVPGPRDGQACVLVEVDVKDVEHQR